MAAAGELLRGDFNKYFGDKLIANSLSAGLIFATATICFRTARSLRDASPRFAQFWAWSAILFAVAGADEMFRLHERTDALIHYLAGLDRRNKVTDHLDDLLIALYAVPALALWFRHRKDLIRLRWMVLTLAVAFAGFCVMVVLDFTGAPKAVEDGVKILSGTLILIAFLSVRYERSVTRPL